MKCKNCDNDLIGLQKLYCSIKCKNKSHQSYDQQQLRGHLRKNELVKLFGGKCTICDYSKNFAALAFHHLRDKEFGLDLRSLSNRTWDSILAEAKKCQLVCSNCHLEIHNPNYLILEDQ